MIVGIVLIPVLWLGIPALTSKSPFSAASLAEHSPRAIHGNKITGTFDRFLGLNAASIKIAALIAVGLAVVRRDRPVLLLAGGVAPVGGGRGRVRAARLAGGAPLHVRGGEPECACWPGCSSGA